MNGLHFQQSYSHMFEISGGGGGGGGGGGVRITQKFRISKRDDLYYIKWSKCANSFQKDLDRRLYKVDA